MIEYRCDMCGKSTKRNYIAERYMPRIKNFQVEIMVSRNDCWNNGEICKECLLKIINKGTEGSVSGRGA
jgi:hypothetical protein